MTQAAQASRLEGRRILLGVSGGIAAYKACELASRLHQEQASVTVVLTRNAEHFVTPYSFEALTGRPCLTEMFRRISGRESPFTHLDMPLEAELIILAPATANLIARLASGLADELLTSICLAARCPILVCPAMNSGMWEHPATRRNVKVLQEFGYRLLGPAEGLLACGSSGLGRLVEPVQIIEAAVELLGPAGRGQFPGAGARGRSRRRGGKQPPAARSSPPSPPSAST